MMKTCPECRKQWAPEEAKKQWRKAPDGRMVCPPCLDLLQKKELEDAQAGRPIKALSGLPPE